MPMTDRAFTPNPVHEETLNPTGCTLPQTTAPPADPHLPEIPGYEILGELGRGSMGVVYKARQIGLDRLVALKMVLAGDYASQEVLQRFMVEARVVGSLQHPNITQIYEVRLHEERPFFAMEFVEGGTLADRLGGRPQPPRQAAQWLTTVARAIHVAHLSGIVHRDLKPANILLASAASRNSHVQRLSQEMGLDKLDLPLGMPKITDFGLAKQLHADAGQTESGMILGTASYMAPEQAEGKSRAVGPAADIYALGAILYEMLTGRPPFTAESPVETVLLLFQAEPVRPSQLQPRIPRDLETIVLKCLHKDPARRYSSAEALADDLQRFLAGEPICAKPASARERAWKWARRRPALAALLGSVFVGIMSLVGLILWHHTDLQVRLGQALEDERLAREAEEEAADRERLTQLGVKVNELLHAAEAALAAQDWQGANLQLSRARDQVADESGLVQWQPRIERLADHVAEQRRARERLKLFVERHNEALFQATLFTGDDAAAARQTTQNATVAALALFGLADDSSRPPEVDSPFYSARERSEVVAGCYELLFIWADVSLETVSDQSDEERRVRARQALRILDRAAQLDVKTQAYHRRRAHYLALGGDQEAAASERRRADSLAPRNALDHFLLGQEEYRAGDTKKAIASFENVLQIDPEHFWASYYVALGWLKAKQPNQAIASLTACLSRRRDMPWPYLLRGLAWGELGRFDRAEADFDVALKTSLPDSARYSLLINRGVLRLRQGRIDTATDDLQEAITLRPQQYQGYVNLAQAYLKTRKLDDALAQLDKAVEHEPNLAALYRTRARVHLLNQDQAAALADLERAIALTAPESSILADDHAERGRLLHVQKSHAKALEAYSAALRLRPRDARVSRLRAEALLDLQRLPEALQALDDCVRDGPPDSAILRARAALRTRLGHYAGAQADYTRALDIAPDAETYAARGWCFLVADAPRLALPDFEEAIRFSPKAEQGDAYAGRGYARALLGQHLAAVSDAETALERGPLSSRLVYNVTRIYAQAIVRLDEQTQTAWSAGQRSAWQERAVALLTRALELHPSAEQAPFWNNVVQTDKALNPLRGATGYWRLANRYPPQRVSIASDRGAPPR